MIEHTVALHAAPGTFRPTSFTEWIGHEVAVTSLDPSLRHVLRAVDNTEDGTRSTLTIQTYSDLGPNLTADLSIYHGTPKAHIRAYLADNDQYLVTCHLDAPLQPGQRVTFNAEPYDVRDITWPYRDPDHPESTEDYQRVTIALATEPAAVLDLGMAGLGAGGAILGLLT